MKGEQCPTCITLVGEAARFSSTQHQQGRGILKAMKSEKTKLPSELLVNAKDRKYQVWERNSLGVPLWTHEVFEQKLEYIHNNPVKAGLCKFPEDYKYSSARFYENNEKDWVFLTHHEG